MASSLDMLSRVRGRAERALAMSFLEMPRPILRGIAGTPRRSPEGYALDLQTQTLLRLSEITGQDAPRRDSIDAERSILLRNSRLFDRPTSRPVRSRDLGIPGPAGSIPVRIYEPEGVRGPAPIVTYFHGGGFVLGCIESHHNVCELLADRANAIVVSVEYRLAPEHKFPSAVDDALAATRWVFAHADELGGARDRVAVGGDSAGGNLSAVVSLLLRDDAARPAHQWLLYPCTDFTRSFESHRHFREGYMLTEASIVWFLRNYVRDSSDEVDVRASPWFAPDLRGLPPATVIVAGFDPLRDEGQAYAGRMREAGVSTDLRVAESLVHGFASMTGGVRVAARIFDDAARRLGETLRSGAHAR